MTTTLIAAAAMIPLEILATIMIMAEAKEHGWLAGLLDMAS